MVSWPAMTRTAVGPSQPVSSVCSSSRAYSESQSMAATSKRLIIGQPRSNLVQTVWLRV